LWVTGYVRRVLVLAPKNVTRQWWDELRGKFGLPAYLFKPPNSFWRLMGRLFLFMVILLTLLIWLWLLGIMLGVGVVLSLSCLRLGLLIWF
jgi:hypothetical protein